MSKRTADELLSLLRDLALEDLEHTPDEELLREAMEDGEDIQARLAALKQHVHHEAEQLQLHSGERKCGVIDLQARKRLQWQAEGVSRSELWGSGKSPPHALEAEEQALAASILMKLYDSSRARCRSDLPFDFAAESLARRDEGGAELIKELLLQLVERWIRLRMDESAALAERLPESWMWILRRLLRNSVADPQILKFASISLGTLVSTLCTSALARASGLDVDLPGSSPERDELLHRIRATDEWRAFHNLIGHEPRLVTDSVDPAGAISALATMQRALAAYNPDAIVAVAGGGKIVGDFLRQQLGMSPHRYFVAEREDGRYKLKQPFPQCGCIKTVVIIDDISRTGQTLVSIRDDVFGGMDGIELKALALVSAAVAIDRIKDLFLLLPVVAQSSNVSVPWDTKGTYRAKGKFYLFGDGGNGTQLEIPRKLYQQTYGEVGT
jgi:hypothetical protein